MKLVRFRVVEPDLTDDTSAISYGVMVGEKIWCACGCGGSFEPDEVEVLDSYEPTEDVIAGVMGWPYNQCEQLYICPVADASCPYWREGDVCIMGRPDEDCDDFIKMREEEAMWEDCDNDCGYDPYLGCFTDDC